MDEACDLEASFVPQAATPARFTFPRHPHSCSSMRVTFACLAINIEQEPLLESHDHQRLVSSLSPPVPTTTNTPQRLSRWCANPHTPQQALQLTYPPLLPGPPHHPRRLAPNIHHPVARRPLRPRRPRYSPRQPVPQHTRPQNPRHLQRLRHPVLSPPRIAPHSLARPTRQSQNGDAPATIRDRGAGASANGAEHCGERRVESGGVGRDE